MTAKKSKTTSHSDVVVDMLAEFENKTNSQFDKLENRMGKVEKQLDNLTINMQSQFAQMQSQFAEFRKDIIKEKQ